MDSNFLLSFPIFSGFDHDNHDPNSGLNNELYYRNGDFFGEKSAFFNKPEPATVENSSPPKTLKIYGLGLRFKWRGPD